MTQLCYTRLLDGQRQWNRFYAPGLSVSPEYTVRRQLEAKGCTLLPAGEAEGVQPDAVLHMGFPEPELFLRWPEAVHIYWVDEPKVIIPYNSARSLRQMAKLFDAVLTYDDDAVEEAAGIYKLAVPFEFGCRFVPEKSFEEKRLACSISSDNLVWLPTELYTQRRRMIEWFEKNHPDEFSFYGKGWRKKYQRLRTYGGTVDCKLHVYDQYKFALCFENSNGQPGYITEKMFDCFLGGTVPVYDGPSNIGDYVPENCFISYREYRDPEKLYRVLTQMSEERWREYRQNIDAFCKSRATEIFSPERAAQTAWRAIQAGKRVHQTQKEYAELKKILTQNKWFMRLHARLPNVLAQKLDR